MLADDLDVCEDALRFTALARGGPSVGNRLKAAPDVAEAAASAIANPDTSSLRQCADKFTVHGAHDALVAALLHIPHSCNLALKIVNDIRLNALRPRARFAVICHSRE